MRYLFVPIRGGFSVHAEGCAGIGRKARMATQVHNLDHDVQDARARGHIVRFCRCTGIREAPASRASEAPSKAAVSRDR
jgi:hypothetical protein